MRDPASTAVHLLCGCLAVLGHELKVLEEWVVAFRQICDFCGPIVHLYIDVDRVFGAPYWHKMLVPDALQVRWETRERGRYQEISSVVKKKRDKVVVVLAISDSLNTLVGWMFRRWTAEVEGDSVKEMRILLHDRNTVASKIFVPHFVVLMQQFLLGCRFCR
jgi:hypothetical protein